jgi:hypothetical protein
MPCFIPEDKIAGDLMTKRRKKQLLRRRIFGMVNDLLRSEIMDVRYPVKGVLWSFGFTIRKTNTISSGTMDGTYGRQLSAFILNRGSERLHI